jgi:hypothetical protein
MKATNGPEIRAIPTAYRGIEFRSRLEATVAQFLDRIGWGWSYEADSFLLDNGIHYRPDFRVTWHGCRHLWIECRGYESDKGQAQIDGFAALVPTMHPPARYLVFQSGENYSSGFPCPDPETDHRPEPWLSRCQVCGNYCISTAAELDEGACEECDCRSLVVSLERIEFRDAVLYVGDVPMSEWRPI